MRLRKDIQDGDLVIKNKGGWIVPVEVSARPVGEVISVYKDGTVEPFGIVYCVAEVEPI